MGAFDETVWMTHPEDFQLLHHGHLHLYRHRWALSRLVTDLAPGWGTRSPRWTRRRASTPTACETL
jgi:hypothetical protein